MSIVIGKRRHARKDNKGDSAGMMLTSLMDIFIVLVLYLLVNQGTGVELDPPGTVTALIVRVDVGKGPGKRTWKDYYVNNWFHHWGAEADRKALRHYANTDPHYTVYGFLGGTVAPLDKEGQKLVDRYKPAYGGIIFHGRVAKADTPKEAFVKLKELVPNAVVTDGPHGAYVRFGGAEAHVPAFPCEPKDLTGAGDMFAGAFLYGVTHGVEPVRAARAANYLAMKVITQVGARLHHGTRELWDEALSAM